MARLAELYATIAADIQAATEIFREELDSDQPFIRDLCRHIERFHGKQVRPALLLLSARACGGVGHEHRVLAAVVEMVHIATLVHDDVLDEAESRRQAATVNTLAGNERAVLLGDFLISHAYHLCSSVDTQAARLIARTTNEVCEGEMMQVAQRGNWELREEQYTEIIRRKTASLIGACCLLGARYAGADERTERRLARLGVSLGSAFQIVDDLLDITGEESVVGKSLGRDVAKGKLTLPLIHYLRECGPRRKAEILGLLVSEAPDRQARIAERLADSDSIEYARQVAQSHVADAQGVIAELPPSEARDALSAVAEFVLYRRQ
ncbi:MAG TPA: polyprenyl synthetase family protein [Phycisphaerae bacterium]|nr:polyprenyl synthetase family protein [Phycisphaerae bacterium]